MEMRRSNLRDFRLSLKAHERVLLQPDTQSGLKDGREERNLEG
jgi:hypothetical protein